MQDWIIQVMNQYGYIGILLLIMLENIFPPIPSEVILTFGGFMTTYTSMKVWGVIIFSTIGSVLGAIILYGVGRWLSPQRLEKWIEGKVGKILRFKKEDISKATNWFSRKGKITVFFCRCIPIVRSLISIPAGIAKMNMALFLVLTIAGSFIWNIVLVYLGVIAGASWGKIAAYIDTYSDITLLILAAAIIVAAIVFYKKRTAKNK